MFSKERYSTNKKGMTLIEMLVAVSILTLGMAGFTMLGSKTWKFNSFILESGNATNKATKAMNDTIKNLRKVRQADDGSYPIKAVSSTSLTVYIDDDDDNVTERVHYYLDDNADTFIKGVAKPSGSPLKYPENSSGIPIYTNDQITIISNYVVNTTSQPVFEYYDGNYPIVISNNPIPVASLNTSDVKLVKVRLWVNIKPLTAPDNINLESFVEFRNLNENN
jgi:prepilin-type N-terminal cleavage/methylation domain-containing protein